MTALFLAAQAWSASQVEAARLIAHLGEGGGLRLSGVTIAPIARGKPSRETPSPYTEYGIKGGGEGGRMGAPPAICSAIEDALHPLGVKVDALPITPRRLRTLIREAQAAVA